MKYLILLLPIIVFNACSTTKNIDLSTVENPSEVQQWILDRNFEISVSYANPTLSSELIQIANTNLIKPGDSSGRISLTGNSNFLKITSDSVQAYLPYFGTRQIISGFGNDTGAIKFNGKPKNYSSSYTLKNNRTSIKFSIENNTEYFEVSITVFSNKVAEISINSSQRNSIRYDGNVYKITE